MHSLRFDLMLSIGTWTILVGTKLKGQDGKYRFVVFIENGRIQDDSEPGKDFKTGLWEIAKLEVHRGTFRLMANQHLVLSDIAQEDLSLIKGLLRKYNLNQLQFSGLRLSSLACLAFLTCGLAISDVPAWPRGQKPGQARPWFAKPSQAIRPRQNFGFHKNYKKFMTNHKNI
jgi:hypothetical protein